MTQLCGAAAAPPLSCNSEKKIGELNWEFKLSKRQVAILPDCKAPRTPPPPPRGGELPGGGVGGGPHIINPPFFCMTIPAACQALSLLAAEAGS